MAPSPLDDMLDGLRGIDGFVLACLVDGDTGMVLGSVQDSHGLSVPVAAAGAADVINVLSLMSGELALKGELEDIIVTLSSHFHLIRALPPGPAGQPVLLVTLDRSQANLAMARREIRGLNPSAV